MNPDKAQFLNLRSYSARLNVEEAAWLLGFLPHEIPMLVSAGLLKSLGNPAPNSTKYFSTVELECLRNNRRWLANASDAIRKHWRNKTDRKRFLAHQRSLAKQKDPDSPVCFAGVK